jgi:hypothetical protein
MLHSVQHSTSVLCVILSSLGRLKMVDSIRICLFGSQRLIRSVSVSSVHEGGRERLMGFPSRVQRNYAVKTQHSNGLTVSYPCCLSMERLTTRSSV